MTDTIIATHPNNLPLRRSGRSLLVTIALVVLADYLLFRQWPGIGLFVVNAAMALGILIANRQRIRSPRAVLALAFSLATALPLVETPSIPGILLAMLGLSILALSVSRLLPRTLSAMLEVVVRFAALAPFRMIWDVRKISRWPRFRISVLRNLVVWIVPTVFAALFVALFAAANPLIEGVVDRFDPTPLFDPIRVAFWGFVAAVCWALIRPALWRRKRHHAKPVVTIAQPVGVLFGEGATLRSLLVFNALFAVQTLLDLTYLWGGAALPNGMTHAEYAHRGAYPLIATALLAAAFVLAAMRKDGPGEQRPLMRWLVYAWIGQNVLLCISSILRLDLYVEVYTLTELRIAAGIWMGLVAAGLVLILLRIVLRRSNAWLIAMNLLALTATLYVCAFIDFSAVIARFNIEHSYEWTGEGIPLDLCYLQNLGPSALPALDSLIAKQPMDRANTLAQIRSALVAEFEQRPRDWRSWTYRDTRLQAYLDQHKTIASR